MSMPFRTAKIGDTYTDHRGDIYTKVWSDAWQLTYRNQANTSHPKPYDNKHPSVSDTMDFEIDFGTFDNESPALPRIPSCDHSNRSKQVFTTFSFWQCDDCKEDLGDVK